jgi:hypothetical protein
MTLNNWMRMCSTRCQGGPGHIFWLLCRYALQRWGIMAIERGILAVSKSWSTGLRNSPLRQCRTDLISHCSFTPLAFSTLPRRLTKLARIQARRDACGIGGSAAPVCRCALRSISPTITVARGNSSIGYCVGLLSRGQTPPRPARKSLRNSEVFQSISSDPV